MDIRFMTAVWIALAWVPFPAQQAKPVPLRYELTAPDVLAARVRAASMKNADRGAKLEDMFLGRRMLRGRS
jgi:hypothetical protein